MKLKEDQKIFPLYPLQKLRILLSGSSGFIGSQLKSFFSTAGHQVICLVRKKQEVAENAIFWDPIHGNLNKEDFEGFDAVIHLAGARFPFGRWSKKIKEQIFLSRCRDTWLLSQVLCRLYSPPRTLISVSAIGFYGNRGQEELTEESPAGQGFLADLCQKWEKATESIENRGTRVIHPRLGVVLGKGGGMLPKMLRLVRWGLGGKLGSGQQMISWIEIDDLLQAFDHCLNHDAIDGPINFVAPHPVSQADFTKMLARYIHRPAFCHIPASLLKAALGEMATEILLSSQKVIPEKLLKTGYVFHYADLQAALNHVISR